MSTEKCDNNIKVKEDLSRNLLESVKQCQIRFGGKTELATENCRHVEKLCFDWENILNHGLKSDRSTQLNDIIKDVGIAVRQTFSSPHKPTFWSVILEILSKDEVERFMSLANITCEDGYGRAWLRSALNEHSLERYMYMMVNDCDLLSSFYDSWSFLLDDERSSILPVTAAGTQSILFAINIDNSQLNDIDINLLYISEDKLAPVVNCSAPSRPERKKRKPHKQVIEFDEACQGDSENVPSEPGCLIGVDALSNYEDLPSSEIQVSQHDMIRRIAGASGSLTNISLLSNDSDNFECEFKDTNLRFLTPTGSPCNDTVLTPFNDNRVGELIPVSVPSICSESSIYDEDSFDKDSKILCADYIPVENKEEDMNKAIHKAIIKIEDIESQQRKAVVLLENERDRSSSLSFEIKEMQAKHKDAITKMETRIENLQKENQALKEQLKNYVDAVKLLKQPKDWKADIVKKIDELNGSSKDYYKEALQFEEKLIQVAEMHGELLEFNDKLQKQLNQREVLVCQLRKELISLRGPMPDGLLEFDDLTASVENPIGVYRSLINIWIPSVFLAGKGRDIHHVYQIFVRIKDQEWNVYRRYSMFHALFTQMKKLHNTAVNFDFPPKKTIGSRDSNLVDNRRKRLQTYMRNVINFVMNNYILCPPLDSKENLLLIFPFLSEELPSKDKKASLVLPDNRLQPVLNVASVPSHQYTGL